MDINGYLTREAGGAWRDVAGEVVMVADSGTVVRVLNKAASHIWLLADGTRCVREIGLAVQERFDVAPDRALADTEEFCRQLLAEGLASLRDAPVVR